MKTRIMVSCLLILAPFLAVSQGTPTLAVTTTPVKVDGVFDAKEYSLVTEAAGIRLGLTRTADTLYVGVSAATTGWVAAGFGSPRMDGAVMYLGHASGTSGDMKIQKGMGHRHADVETEAPRQYGIRETAGTTVLEVALPADTVIAAGQGKLTVILAMGATDSFSAYHKARATVAVDLAR